MKAIELRIQGYGWHEIADQLGYGTPSLAAQDFGRAMKQRMDQQEALADMWWETELARLDALEREVWQVLKRRHLTVQHGKVVREDGEPIIDDAPLLAATDRLVKIAERRAKLLGLDSPTKVEGSTTVRYEIPGIDPETLR